MGPLAVAAVSAGISTVTGILGGMSQKREAQRQAAEQANAENRAIIKDRLNTAVRNSYQAAMMQTQIALRKKQYAQQNAGVTATKLALRGDVVAAQSSTGTTGSSAVAVQQDIQMQAEQALDQASANLEAEQQNMNTELEMIALNTKMQDVNVSSVRYNGPSTGSMVFQNLARGAADFASHYALQRIKLGKGG